MIICDRSVERIPHLSFIHQPQASSNGSKLCLRLSDIRRWSPQEAFSRLQREQYEWLLGFSYVPGGELSILHRFWQLHDVRYNSTPRLMKEKNEAGMFRTSQLTTAWNDRRGIWTRQSGSRACATTTLPGNWLVQHMTLPDSPEGNPHCSWKRVSEGSREDQGTVWVLMEVQNQEMS